MKKLYSLNKFFSPLVLLFIVLSFTISTTYAGDKKGDTRKKFNQAMKHFNKKDYNLALPIFNELSVKNPDNMNLKFLIGLSYLNSGVNKNLAVHFFENASKNINADYFNNYKQIAAPIHTLYYLGQAYEATGDYQKAITSYESFKKHLTTPKLLEQIAEVNERINVCRNAIKNLELAESNLSVVHQNKQIISTPVKKVVYQQAKQSQKAITVSQPKVMTTQINEADVVAKKTEKIEEVKNIKQTQIAEKVVETQVVETYNSKTQEIKKQEKVEIIVEEPVQIVTNNEIITPKINKTPVVDKSSTNNDVFTENNFYVQFATGKVNPQVYSNFTENVYVCNGKDGIKRYITGTFANYNEAANYKTKIINLGFKDAWVAKKGVNYIDCKKVK